LISKEGIRSGRLIHEHRAGLFEIILNQIYPERCLLCRTVIPGKPETPLCISCLKGYTRTGQICFFCESFGSAKPVCRCIPKKYPLKGLMSLCFYENSWRDLLHSLKYHGKRFIARPLGAWIGSEVSKLEFCSPDLVVPIPLHRNRERERGFNQSALIARSAAKELGVPYSVLLEKVKDTPSQTRVSRRERRENVYKAFCCRKELESGTVILLIDDIYSTGSTMREPAKVLQDKGAIVYGAVVAYNRRAPVYS
jgi:competence protein ComFC